jgi:hypothetical protein
MRTRVLVAIGALPIAVALSLTGWVAFPTNTHLDLVAPLQPWSARDSSSVSSSYAKDLQPLIEGFSPQIYRTFCGPASIVTVLRAYGDIQVDQGGVFPTLGSKVDAFYTGMSLAELENLARSAGMRTERAHADTLSLNAFRERLKHNLAHDGDFVLVNYDRRVLKQSGVGHISPVGAYDETRDAFLILDSAAHKYPFTWVPTPLLYEAVRTRDGAQFRGVIFIQGHGPVDQSQRGSQ